MRIYKVTLAALACLSLASVASARSRDPLACYKAGTEFAGTSAHVDDDVSATDPGGANTFFVKKAMDYCVPTKVSSTTPLDSDPWVLFAAKRAGGECDGDSSIACKKNEDCGVDGPCNVYTSKFNKKDARNRSVRVRDSRVDIRLDFAKELGVLAPASVGNTAPTVGERDFYKCYGVKQTKASCVGGSNDGEACKDGLVDCPGGACVPNVKFPATPLSAVLDDSIADPSTQAYNKLKMVCQAASADGEAVVHDGTALLCYSTKQTAGGSFLPPAPIQATTEFGAASSYEVKKRDVFCTTACIGDDTPDPLFTQYVLKASSLQIGASGTPGQGLDIDNDPNTCSPQPGCSGGIDNELANLAAIANPALVDAVSSGSINLLFQLSQFADGSQQVAGFVGELALPASCTDVNDPNELCNYNVSPVGLTLGDTCRQESLISLPVSVSGTGTPPSATASGDGAIGTTFSLALDLGGFQVNLDIQNIKIRLDLNHDGSDVQSGSGILGGAIPLDYLRGAVASVSGSCTGGANAGAACTNDAACDSANCELALGQSPQELSTFVSGLLPADLNLDGSLNCKPGTAGINNYEKCETSDDCLDPTEACEPNESLSLALVFNLIDAEIVGVE